MACSFCLQGGNMAITNGTSGQRQAPTEVLVLIVTVETRRVVGPTALRAYSGGTLYVTMKLDSSGSGSRARRFSCGRTRCASAGFALDRA
jgi:hypothetical protein